MARAMLEYSKTVLQKVSFDAKLFSKELKKAIARLLPYEIEELKVWLMQFITDKPELQPSLIYLKVQT
jgi:DNA replication protein DnaD